MTNWRSGPQTQRVQLEEQLGLDGGRRYVVFDFWNQREVGVIGRALEADVDAHDTRVLFVHPLLDRPQLVGMSRHISGTYSLEKVEWVESRRLLLGMSDALAGETYALWIHVPEGFREGKVSASAGGRDVAVTSRVTGQSLEVRFRGERQPVDWEVEFTELPDADSLRGR
jgi:hypothetical protein